MPNQLRRLVRTRWGLGLMAGLLVLIVALAQTPWLRVAPPASRPATAGVTQVAGQEPNAGPASSSAAAAQDAPPSSRANGGFSITYQDPQVEPAPNGVLTVFSLLLKLAIVIALIYGTVWVLRFLNHRTAKSFLGQRAVTVIETTRLAANRDLYLVDVADKVLLLGATAGSLSLLSEITGAEALETIRARQQTALPSADAFLNYLRGFGEKLGVSPAGANPASALDAPVLTQQVQDDVSFEADPVRTPADLLLRIQESRQRIRQRTLTIQESASADTHDVRGDGER